MEPKKKIFVSIVIFIIINLALIIILIFPFARAIEKNSQDLILQKQELILLSEKSEKTKNLKNIYQVHQKNLEKIDALFIDPETPIDFIGFLEKNAEDSQVKIKKSLASDKTQETDFGPALSFNISLESSVSNFMKFLEKLENAPYLIEIPNLNINALGEKSLGNINATISIRVLTK
jgi:hypothetical protein